VPNTTIVLETHNLYKGFYVQSPNTQTLIPVYDFPAEIHGYTVLIPQSKFQNDGVAILNFCLSSFDLDTGDLGKVLEPFASAFFSKEGSDLLIVEHIAYDLGQVSTCIQEG